MSEALIRDAGSSLLGLDPCPENSPVTRRSIEVPGRKAKHCMAQLVVSEKACDGNRSASVVESMALPTVQPGQLWFVELPATEPKLSPLEYQALTTANVVIYDRSIASTVAGFLPLGGYAEPAAPNDGASDVVLERCLRFARDGWSVARLVDPQVSPGRERVGMIRELSERLLALKSPADLRVLVFANAGGGYDKSETQLYELGDFLDASSFERSLTLTIVFGAIDSRAAPRFSVASANGLAG